MFIWKIISQISWPKNIKSETAQIPFFSGIQNWQVLILFFIVLFAFWSWKVTITGSERLDIFLSGTLADMTILCSVSFWSDSEKNSPDRNAKEYTWVLLAFMRSDCGTKSLAKDNWFAISPSTLCISSRLFLSCAMNVKLLDLFWIAKAIFCFLKTFSFTVDTLVKYTASLSKFLKNVDGVSFSSSEFSKTSWSVSKNLSATSKILSVIPSVCSIVKIETSQTILGAGTKQWKTFCAVLQSWLLDNLRVDAIPRLFQILTIPKIAQNLCSLLLKLQALDL